MLAKVASDAEPVRRKQEPRWRNAAFQKLHPESSSGLRFLRQTPGQESFHTGEGRGLTSEIQNFSFTFWVVVCEQLDVKLLGKCGEVGRHHAAGGQVDLVTAGLHLV